LEQERWDRTDVPSQYKVILEQLLGKEQLDIDTTEQTSIPALHVDGMRFYAVPAVLTLIQLLNEYVKLCSEFEALPEVVIQRLLGLLKLFNGRTHSLVLGAQAVSKQTLKKITASNLALCSQSCGLVAQILPSLQVHLKALFPVDATSAASATSTSQAIRRAVAGLVEDLSKIATEFADHRTALHGKLSDLLHDRYTVHAKKWLNSPHSEVPKGAHDALWDAEAAAQAEPAAAAAVNLCPHDSLEGFAKEVTNMYRVLLKNLTHESVRKIFAKAFEEIAAKFKARLSEEMMAVSTPPYEAKVGRTLGDRLLLDVAYLKEQLGKLSGISTPLQRLLVDMVSHIQSHVPASDQLKGLHPNVLEALHRQGRLPR